jgi:hypothetical protein
MIGRLRTICVVAAALPIAACASFSGAPEPVLDLRTVTAINETYYPASALVQIESERDKAAYRNRVMAIYMAAMDARYADFRTSLSKHLRGTNFGLEVLTLGVGGIGSVWSKAAQEINAGTTFLTGSKGAFNKEVYLQQTLPALVAMMDANRLKVAGDMVAKQSRTIEQYPLSAAFADLSRYELAASVDSAVQQLTKEAALAAADEERKFSRLTASCGPTREVGDLRGKISDKAYDFAGFDDPEQLPAALPANANTDDLALIASVVLGKDERRAATPAEAARQVIAISDTLLGICEVNRLQGFVDQINGRAKRTIIL